MFLSRKEVTVAIIGIVLLVRLIQLIFFNNIHRDGMYQIMAMQNFLDGHGISMSKVLASDLSLTVYQHEVRWPPGYSLLLSPFYLLLNQDYSLAVLTLTFLSAIAVLFYSRRLLFLLDIPLYLVNLFTLLTGFIIYSFYFTNSSDTIAIAFFTMAIYYTFRVIKQNSFSFKNVVALSTCLFFCGFIKYMYIPLILIVPAFIFLKGYADKSKILKKSGITSLIFLFITAGSLLIWQKISGGSAAYIKDLPHGFYPENLKTTYPAFSAPFLNPLSLAMVFGYEGKMALISFRILQLIHLFFFIFLSCYVFRKLIKSGFKNISLATDYYYLFYFLSTGLILLLVVLSLRVANEEILTGYNWTYVQEPRYYGLIAIMMYIGLFPVCTGIRKKIIPKFKLLPYLFFLLMLPEAFRGINFTLNRITHYQTETYRWKNENQILNYADKIIKDELKKYGNEAVAVTGSFDIFYYAGIYSRIPVLIESSKINDVSSLNSKKPTTLLVILKENDLPAFKEFLKNDEKKVSGQFGGFYFYTVHVKPR